MEIAKKNIKREKKNWRALTTAHEYRAKQERWRGNGKTPWGRKRCAGEFFVTIICPVIPGAGEGGEIYNEADRRANFGEARRRGGDSHSLSPYYY